jgi:streptomycin 6-kinase
MQELERIAREVAAEWGVELGPPFALSNYSYVAPAGDDAVLKVQLPEDVESAHEPEALALWDGDGAVRLLRHDPARKVLLLERARPGSDLTALPDDDATATAIEVAQRLWRPAGAPYRSVHDQVPGWLDEAGDHELVAIARERYATLPRDASTLIHGDFHHYNVLRHGDAWVAIDPKAMLADREFDVPSFLWNPIRSTPTHERTERRIAAFVAAGLDEARIRAWTIVRGTYLGLPLDPGEREEESAQLRIVRFLVRGES